ncbi:MAG: F0F1 ATP synthase subunit delta [Proteobacteria bacterium]|nr:F0F1 ATP synthase subunit delta [Pseudomonadota bacterium]
MTIDWSTLALEAINVAVLMALLGHFFWKPVAALLDERKTAIAHDLADAAAKRSAAETALAAVATERAGIQKEREGVLAKAVADGERERSLRVDKAKDEIEILRAASEAAVAKEKLDVTKALNDKAAALAIAIATRLLNGLDARVLKSPFLDGLAKQIKSLSPSERQSLAGQPLKLSAATELTPDQEQECLRAIEDALGTRPDLSFAFNPDLIAGFALESPNVVVGNSWRHDLDRIRSELAHE